MYILLGDNKLKDDLKPSLKKRDIEADDFTEDQISSLIGRIKDDPEKIDGIILFSHLNEDMDELIKVIKEIKVNIKTMLVDQDVSKTDKKYIDLVIEKDDLVIDSILKEIERIEFEKNSSRLIDVISNADNVSIFIHDNPDPDAIASAMAFEEICEYLDVRSTTYYGGLIGHPENEVFINNTGFLMENIDKDEVGDIVKNSEKIVFLDFAESSINSVVPEDISPDIIIDHHYTNKEIDKGQYTEIRTDMGATSTIITKHLQNLDIDIEPLLASALLYGIKVDTNDYTKNIHTSDFKVISYLMALADKELLDIFESPPMKSETISALGRAINSRDFKKGILTAFAGHITFKDDIPQIAEFLMRERDVMTLLIFGILDDKIHMSARSKDLKTNIGEIMKNAFSDIGSAGGHRHSAGGVIPLENFDNKDQAKIEITRRFKEEVIKG